MAGSQARPKLHVEGQDDEHVLRHLLIRHGVGYDVTPEPPHLPQFNQVGNVEELLDLMPDAVKASSSGPPVGFVLDADVALLARWQAVKDHLAVVGVDFREKPPSGGFIGQSSRYRCSVGVWLMPDNQHDGRLETFLRDLIHDNDPLIGHATASTERARELGARFRDVRETKAVIHCWLAWQEEPGLPYGTAIRAKYFTHQSRAAQAFVDWFKRLYSLA